MWATICTPPSISVKVTSPATVPPSRAISVAAAVGGASSTTGAAASGAGAGATSSCPPHPTAAITEVSRTTPMNALFMTTTSQGFRFS